MIRQKAVWPKITPALSAKQQEAREQFMLLWHKHLPLKYQRIERFNHGYVARLPLPKGCKTLEIGAGIGGHLEFEDLTKQEYHCLELREELCAELMKILPPSNVYQGNIELRQPWSDGSFDRIVAIHVLEHLTNLPKAVDEVDRLLKKEGCFDVVIPCEGGFAYSLARKVSAERFFKKKFRMDYTPIIQNEHVNKVFEIQDVLKEKFKIEKSAYFPLLAPVPTLNLCIGMRLRKKMEVNS